jgi:hypothetical protein
LRIERYKKGGLWKGRRAEWSSGDERKHGSIVLERTESKEQPIDWLPWRGKLISGLAVLPLILNPLHEGL